MSGVQGDTDERLAEQAAIVALQSTGRLLPHLCGLAQLVRASASTRTPTAAVFPSGRIVVNPRWFLRLSMAERVFVVAHEMLHLALRTHERCRANDARLFNIAHDYIINDMLREELGCRIPALGLDMPGASERSAEEIVAELKAQGGGRGSAWAGAAIGTLGEAMVRAGLTLTAVAGGEGEALDALDAATERAWFPPHGPQPHPGRDDGLGAEIERSLALGAWKKRLAQLLESPEQGSHAAAAAIFGALRGYVRPPWELALQRWLEDVAPGARTFARPSRRQGERGDVVLAGRSREAWTLNLILDTSGSMWDALSNVLGVVAGFCEAVNILTVRILQCSNGLERDEIVAVADLAGYSILGGGSSDLRPGFRELAADPSVDAAVVATDGMITYPNEPMPFAVLWTLFGGCDGFAPPYGEVIRVEV